MTASARHISHEKLADLVEDLATPEQRARSIAHISVCSRCATDLRRLEHLVSLMKTDRSEDAPRDVVAHAVSIFRQRGGSREPPVVRRLIAALSFDSLNTAPAFGLRSSQSASRQLIYSAEENDIDLRLTLQDDMWIVAGQILREDCAGGRVEIKGVRDSVSATLNETCEFSLPAVLPGNYSLRLVMSDVEIEVPQLELKA